jgi:hypothetical protein
MARSISPAVSYSDGAQLHPERRRCGLDYGVLADPGSYTRVPKDRRKLQQGHDLFEQLEPFRAQAVFEKREAGGVAARPRQTFNEARADWVDEIHEHNRDGAS